MAPTKTPVLSAMVITRNEAMKIERCLKSLDWVEEVVVVDDGSEDGTPEIVTRMGACLYSRGFTDFADQKNFTLSKTHGDWVLSIDADEEVTSELRDEITDVIKTKASHAGFRIHRRSTLFGKTFRFTGTQDDKPLRLFRRDGSHFVQPIHESVKVNGSIGELQAVLNHDTYRSIKDYLIRMNRYTTMEAQYRLQERPRRKIRFRALRPLAMFLKLYVWQMGFRDGFQGWIFSLLSGYYVLVKNAKMHEGER